jgi:outer membrane protein assembly factor BamB
MNAKLAKPLILANLYFLACFGVHAQLPDSAKTKAHTRKTVSDSSRYIIYSDSVFFFEARGLYKDKFDSLTFLTGVEDSSGIYTYRGSDQRNSPVRGWLAGRPSEIVSDWFFTTGSDTANGDYGVWGGGAGWTGQPLLVKWQPSELMELTGLKDTFLKKDTVLNELVQVSLAGKIYFLQLETGKQTRKPIVINNPVKGTPAIDGPNRRFLLSGQGIQNRGIFAWRVFDLRTQKLLHTEPMPSSFALRGWGACDGTPLIDRTSGTFIWPTESGVIYRGILDTNNLKYPEEYRYRFSEHPKLGTESSMSVYKYLGYITDNSGNIFCLDLRTMKPRWHFFNSDDTDGSPVVSIDCDTPYVYVGHEVDLQGSKGKAHIRKLNGFTGKMIWQYECDAFSVTKPRTDNGGMLCTPVVGINKAKGLVWTLFAKTTSLGGGTFVCLNDSDGSVKYTINMKAFSWVSPIAMYDREGNPYVYFPDVAGNIYLIDGLSGEIIFKKNLDYVFESSPVAVGNRIVQPARGNRILSFIIK